MIVPDEEHTDTSRMALIIKYLHAQSVASDDSQAVQLHIGRQSRLRINVLLDLSSEWKLEADRTSSQTIKRGGKLTGTRSYRPSTEKTVSRSAEKQYLEQLPHCKQHQVFQALQFRGSCDRSNGRRETIGPSDGWQWLHRVAYHIAIGRGTMMDCEP